MKINIIREEQVWIRREEGWKVEGEERVMNEGEGRRAEGGEGRGESELGKRWEMGREGVGGISVRGSQKVRT